MIFKKTLILAGFCFILQKQTCCDAVRSDVSRFADELDEKNGFHPAHEGHLISVPHGRSAALFLDWTFFKPRPRVLTRFVSRLQIAREHGIRFFETSAKANINIEKAFLTLAEDILRKVCSSVDWDDGLCGGQNQVADLSLYLQVHLVCFYEYITGK